MKKRMSWDELRRIWLWPVFALGVATVLMLGVPFLFDWYVTPSAQRGGLDPFRLIFNYDLETLQNALGNLAQTVAAVVGIVMTVVAIVVQLAATRYTPRVTELFLKERTNVLVLGFFVVSCVMAIWVSLAVGNGFLPKASVIVAVFAVSLSLLLMVPYFAFVFDFLDPERVVSRIRDGAVNHVEDVQSTATEGQVEGAQLQVLQAIEQLSDVSLSAMANHDKIIAARAVDAMRTLGVQYLEAKGELPQAWHTPCAFVQRNPDFVAMHPDSLTDLVEQRLWLEWKILRQWQAIYNEALADNPDMNYLIAIDTRYLGEAAIRRGETDTTGLAIKFFNTYLRSTLNKKQVRTAYNVLNQYRQLVEAIMRASGKRERISEIAGYFRYYGQIANSMNLGFITETIAYDLATLCELAHEIDSPGHDELLGALLELDKEAEDEAQELALRGVRKAQVRLATFYLLKQDQTRARRIHKDMELERPERLISIKNELRRIVSKDFWEVIDRGANFDYMPDERKELLTDFFAWFPWSGREVRPDTAPLRASSSGRINALVEDEEEVEL